MRTNLDEIFTLFASSQGGESESSVGLCTTSCKECRHVKTFPSYEEVNMRSSISGRMPSKGVRTASPKAPQEVDVLPRGVIFSPKKPSDDGGVPRPRPHKFLRCGGGAWAIL